MEKVKTIVLEDGLEYFVVEENKIMNTIYLYLSQVNDKTKFVVRKIKNINNKDVLCPLDDEEEFNSAMIYLSNKYMKKTE